MSLNPIETTSPDLINTRNITPGEYQLHLFIEGTKSLLPPRPEISVINPIILLKAFSQDRCLAEKPIHLSEFTACNEHVFFLKKIPDFQAFEQEKLLIRVSDYKLLGTNALIGEIELAISPFYFSENHSLLHQWVALTNNYKENKNEIQGFVKFSANLVGPGDQASKLEPEAPKDEKKSENLPVIYSPQIQTKCFQIKIQLIKGENLVKMDNMLGSIDSYLLFRFGSSFFKTEVVKNTINPFWGYQILLPYAEPCINEYLEVQIFDWDMSKKDEIIGSITFHKDQIKQKKQKNNFIWINLYGSQLNPHSSETALIMNSNPHLASFWKGRLLLSVDITENPLPKLTTIPELIPQETLQMFKKDSTLQWKLFIEVYYGLGFPENGPFSIEIRWADFEIKTSVKSPENGVWEWYSRFNITCDFPYFNADELPDIFIYLLQGEKRICYIRKAANYFLHQFNSTPEHWYFTPDKAMVPDLKDDEAGLLKFRCVVAVAQAISDLSVGGWNSPIVKKNRKKVMLYAHIYQAQDLIPADSDGNSDPYLEVSYYGNEGRTETVNDSLNPIWYHTIKLEVPSFTSEEEPPIVIKVYDEDEKNKKEFIGSAVINIEEGLKAGWIKRNDINIPTPIWLPLRYSKASFCGKALVSINIIDESLTPLNKTQIFNIIPEMELYHIKIKVLGLRNMKSLGLIPVKRAFLRFDINSVRSPMDRQALSEKKFIQTLPKEPGSNPNVLTMIEFSVQLPRDPHLCPHLNCIVYDCIFKGLFQPILGVFSIDLGKFLVKSDKKFKKLKERPEKSAEKPKITLQDQKNDQNLPILDSSFRRLSEEEKLMEISMETNTEAILFKKEVEAKKAALNKKGTKDEEDSSFLSIEMTELTKKKPIIIEKVLCDNGKINQNSIIVPAQYEYNAFKKAPLEINIPNSSEYLPLGYDSKTARFTSNTKKHYRYYVDKELEKTPFLPETPFDEFIITRGKRINKTTLLSNNNMDLGIKEVGKFKGWIDVESEAERAYKKNHELDTKKLDKQFMEKTHCFVRVYVLSAISLTQMDTDSLSDPYLKLSLGDIVLNNEKEYQTDKTDCDFYKFFEFKTIFPGACVLKVQVWDRDPLTADDLIGETSIDLENRFFSKKWRKLQKVPIETRNLFHPLSNINRGRITLFLEIIPFKSSLLQEPWAIQPRPSAFFQIRVIVWEVYDVPNSDIEGVSDLYVTGTFNGVQCKTDTHFRAQNGKGSFNWRMIWDVELPRNDTSELTFQVWDKDYFSMDDFIGEVRVKIKDEIEEALETENEVKWKDKKEFEFKKFEGTAGKMMMSFEIIPESNAEKYKVGKGREEPNHSPWLPPPIGRFEWALNPITLFNKCLGLKYRAKICAFFCCLLCIILLIYQFPIILGHLFVDAII